MTNVIDFKKKSVEQQNNGGCAEIKFVTKSMSAMADMIGELALIMENKTKETLKKLGYSPAEFKMPDRAISSFLNLARWDVDTNDDGIIKILLSPELVFTCRKKNTEYIFAIHCEHNSETGQYDYPYLLNRISDDMKFEVYKNGTWEPVLGYEDPVDKMNAVFNAVDGSDFMELYEEQFMNELMEMFPDGNAGTLAALSVNSQNLMKLYDKVYDFMSIGYMDAEAAEESETEDGFVEVKGEFAESLIGGEGKIALTLCPDDDLKHGCMVRERNGKFVLMQYMSIFDVSDDDFDDIPDAALDIPEHVRIVAETDDLGAMAKILKAMFGSYVKSNQYIVPLSLSAYLISPMIWDEECDNVIFLDADDRDLTEEEDEALTDIHDAVNEMADALF